MASPQERDAPFVASPVSFPPLCTCTLSACLNGDERRRGHAEEGPEPERPQVDPDDRRDDVDKPVGQERRYPARITSIIEGYVSTVRVAENHWDFEPQELCSLT